MACLCPMYSSHSDQHHSHARWERLDILVGRIPVPCLRHLWLLGWLCSADPISKPASVVHSYSVCVFVSCHSDVLLVAPLAAKPIVVGHIYSVVCCCNNIEHQIPLTNQGTRTWKTKKDRRKKWKRNYFMQVRFPWGSRQFWHCLTWQRSSCRWVILPFQPWPYTRQPSLHFLGCCWSTMA